MTVISLNMNSPFTYLITNLNLLIYGAYEFQFQGGLSLMIESSCLASLLEQLELQLGRYLLDKLKNLRRKMPFISLLKTNLFIDIKTRTLQRGTREI